jgi:hypothetical protein
MAMSLPCDGCGRITSCIVAAQYCHKDQCIIICSNCFNSGVRCWFSDDRLTVGEEKPIGSKEAVLYWDEGSYVTGGGPVTYPSRNQPD